ncbi:GntR family transcriptional regulator [Arthrobacter sp. M4]|uniref:GntR family transcriptional regulator n=1 Tax=Arthrobacter sp. M4 TaxID=218160 RepID=UPI001CDCB8FF|nr:GntR family transcriptional regulator [Arthrobacter sp. M4]MCA4134483.1 GntR family transcriptional regulator [Arthrobacter sp. M4]
MQRGDAASGRQKAYEYLRDQILVDPTMQGTFVNEAELAREVGVSRTPVREALLLLVSDGLIELIPNRGALIPVISGRQISELFELRGVLERYAAASAIAAGTVPTGKMRRALDEQRALVAGHDGLVEGGRGQATEFIRLDQHFHQLLIDAADNDLISQTYNKLRTRQVFIGVEALFRTQDRQSNVCDEHQMIVDALTNGDVAAAQKAIDNHLAVTLDVVLRA